MREHAIPQDVVGYRFHIIGNMTLKQFLEVGAGCVFGVMIYATNLHFLIKWPFIGLSVAIGAMAAFVPFEERPLDHWLVTFIKVLYKPTKFFWKKEPKLPDPFLFEPNSQQSTTIELDLTPARRQRIKEYLSSLDAAPAMDPFEQAELDRMNTILASFQDVQVVQITTATTTVSKPSLTMRTHTLKMPQEVEGEVATGTTRLIEETTLAVTSQVRQANTASFSKPALDVSQVARDIVIPETENVNLSKVKEKAKDQEYTPEIDTQQAAYSTSTFSVQPVSASQTVSTNTELPFPVKPTEPNKLVGMILSPRDELINDAIVEIQTDQGSVVRAVKTNALGQFFVTTPLPNGSYTLLVEKDGFNFEPLSLQVNGSILAPLEIRSN